MILYAKLSIANGGDNFAYNTIQYQYDLLSFIKWLITIDPTIKIQNLTEITAIEYRQSLISVGLKAATINRRIGQYRGFTAGLIRINY